MTIVSLKQSCNQIQEISCVPYTPNTIVSYIGTSTKEGFGPPRVSPLVPVQSRTGTNGGISPGSCAQGPHGPFVPVRLDLLVPVGATTRD